MMLMKKYWILDNGRAHNMDQKTEQLQKLVTAQKPEHADVIVWLQGNGYDRGEKVLELYHKGYAPQILVTGNNSRIVDDDKVGVADIVRWLSVEGIDPKNILADDQSMNTLDQARYVVSKAKECQWSSILLVGSIHHQLRAFLTFLHQAQVQRWKGKIINQPVYIAWNVKPSGRRKTTQEAFQDELVKLEEYQKDVATTEQGLKHIGAI